MEPRTAGAGPPAGHRSPMRNRVTPWGDIVAIEQRGAWLGNRGILHEGTDVVRFHRSDLWITCRLQYRDWRLLQWAPGHFTVLYFFDEAVAFAAGHRPCALCRRADYNAYRSAWVAGAGDRPLLAGSPTPAGLPYARDLDRQLHQERIVRGTHRRRLHPMALAGAARGDLRGPGRRTPPGAGRPPVPAGALRVTAGPVAAGTGTAEVITPPSTVAALRGGYRPQFDAGALTG